MVILFVSPHYEEIGEMPKGGVGMYMRRTAGALRNLGHTPIILSFGSHEMHYIENGVEIFFVHCQDLPVWGRNANLIVNLLRRALIVNKKIQELSRERKIDIIQFSSIQSWAACYYGKTPAVMRLSCYTKLYYRDYPSELEVSIRSLGERLAARRCNAVFAPSAVHANAFAADIHRKVQVIESPFWNESDVYDDSVYQTRLVEKKYFLYYGRLAVGKGILVLAEVLQKFLKQNPEYYFVCCGIEQGGERENAARILRKAAGEHKERFLYMKALPHNLLYPVIMHAEFVVFPSLSDNFSNACMEAMYFERVVIGTDGTSYEQLIDDRKSGLLCVPGDAASLLYKMNVAASMSDQQKAEMGKLARRRINQLSPEISVRKLLCYYQYVIDHTVK